MPARAKKKPIPKKNAQTANGLSRKEETYIFVGVILAILGCIAAWLALPQVQSFVSKLFSIEQSTTVRITYPRDGAELSQQLVDVYGIWESKPEEGQELWLYVYDRSVKKYYLNSIAAFNDGTWRSSQAFIGAADESGSEYKIGVMTLPSSESHKLDSGFIELSELPAGAIKLTEITIFRRPVPTPIP